MPTYEYRCRDCMAPLEVFQSIHDAALTECPECHGTLRKVFGNVGVVFKGSGFYRTDNRSKTRAAGSEPTQTEPGKTEPSKSATAGAAKAADTTSSSGTKSGEAAKPAAAKATAGAAAS